MLELEAAPGAERELDPLARRAATILPQLEHDLGARFQRRFRMVLIAPGTPADSQVAALDSLAPSWAAGYMIPARRIGAIRVERASRYPYGTLESVLAHECAHLLLHDAGARVPLWFEEGLATWEGRRWSLQDAVLYTTSLLTEDVPHLEAMDSLFHATEAEAQLAYAASFAFVSRAARRSSPESLRNLVADSRSEPFARAWERAMGRPLALDEKDWRRESLLRYRWIPILTASSTLWIVVSLLALLAAVRKRQRIRQQREQWDQEPEDQADLLPMDEPENVPDASSSGGELPEAQHPRGGPDADPPGRGDPPASS